MLIHSVTPADFLREFPEYPQLTMKKFYGGFIEGEDTPQGFVISRLHSTNPALYLSKAYAPGAVFAIPKEISEGNEHI